MNEIKDNEVIAEESQKEIKTESNQTTTKKESVQVNLEVHPLFVDILNAIKAWFSKNPLNAFRTKLSEKASLTLFGFEALLTIFTLLVSSNNLLAQLPFADKYISFSGVSSRLFIPSLLFLACYYALLSLTMMVVAKIIKTPSSKYTDAMSLVSIALIPITFLSFIGFIFSFMFQPLTFVATFMYIILFPITLYLGLQVHLGKPKLSPYWVFPVSLIILAIIMFLVLTIITGSMAMAEYSNQSRNFSDFLR